MSSPLEHSKNSVTKYGGKIEDYIPIHTVMDSSRGGFGDKRHRAATHNSWFITHILPQIFGNYIVNNNNDPVSVEGVGRDHILEDFGSKFVPTMQDWFAQIAWQPWMDNGNGLPPSAEDNFQSLDFSNLDKAFPNKRFYPGQVPASD